MSVLNLYTAYSAGPLTGVVVCCKMCLKPSLAISNLNPLLVQVETLSTKRSKGIPRF